MEGLQEKRIHSEKAHHFLEVFNHIDMSCMKV